MEEKIVIYDVSLLQFISNRSVQTALKCVIEPPGEKNISNNFIVFSFSRFLGRGFFPPYVEFSSIGSSTCAGYIQFWATVVKLIIIMVVTYQYQDQKKDELIILLFVSTWSTDPKKLCADCVETRCVNVHTDTRSLKTTWFLS